MTRRLVPTLEQVAGAPVDGAQAVVKERKPRKPTSMGTVRLCDVYKADEHGEVQFDEPLPSGAVVLVLRESDKFDAAGAMKQIATMPGDHAVIRLVGAAHVMETQVPKLSQTPLAL